MRNTFKSGIKGLSFSSFQEAFSSTVDQPVEIVAKEARLIPIGRKDDEMAITSVFLSTLTLVKEFKNLVFDSINLPKSGTIKCYTEVSFPTVFPDDEKKNRRFDGLMLLIAAGKIKDAVIFEMKSGSDEIEKEQIELYIDMAYKLKIDKLVSVSNQFVTKPTDYPIPNLVAKKGISLFHLSWAFVQSLGSILFKNKTVTITDEDQFRIMGEVLRYFNDCGAIKTFNRMGSYWREIVMVIGSASGILSAEQKKKIELIIGDWFQQEKDLGIKMSTSLSESGIIDVNCEKKGRTSLDRLKEESVLFREKGILESIYRIPNSVSPLRITMNAKERSILQEISIAIPEDKTTRGRLAFIRTFLKKAQKENPKEFAEVAKELLIIAKTKGKRNDDLCFTCDVFMDPDKVIIDKNLEITGIEIKRESELGTDFLSPIKVIDIEETKVMQFYTTIMQYCENWKKPSPKVTQAIEETTQEIKEEPAINAE